MDQNTDKTKKLESSYDENPYISKTYYHTQPEKLKSNLRLLDFISPNLKNAKVLEIGCSFGGNIIPFAIENPESTVVGVDLSKVQVDEGNKIIDFLGLKNIRIYHKNILDYNEDFEQFDYIICHGVFSWVDENVQKGILKFIKNHLTKNGLAMISYNTYPGWKSLEVSKDAMKFRNKMLAKQDKDVTGKNQIAYGKGILEFLDEYSGLNKRIKDNFTYVGQKNDYYLLHEYFEVYNTPFYIYDFNELLETEGLAHVVDSYLQKSFPFLSNEILDKIENDCQNDYIGKEQYYDYLTDCQFRSSIITHKDNIKDINISRNIKIDSIKALNYRGFYVKNEEGKYVIGEDKEVVEDEKKALLLETVAKHYPNTVTIDELEKELENKLTTIEICEVLLVLVYQRKIEVYNDKLTVKKEEKLKISDRYRKYVEYFAETKFPVISSYGLSGINDLGLDLLRANVMLLFDGTRTDDYILEILKEKHSRDEIRVDNTESNTVETILKNYVATMRTIIEENFLNK